MKKLICAIICTVLLCLPFTVISHAQQEQPQQHLVVLGDSIAAGYGVAREESYAWLLAESMGFELTNLAFNGNHSAYLRWEVTHKGTTRQAVAEADIIIVSIGGNDFLLEGYDLSGLLSMIARGIWVNRNFMPPIWETFAENFAASIAQIRALNPNAMLIVQTMYNSAPPLPSVRRVFGIAVDGINAAIYACLEQHPEAFLIADIRAAFDSRSDMIATDMLHPTAAGHAIIAHVLSDVITDTQTPLPRASFASSVLRIVLIPILWLVDFLFLRLGVLLVVPGFFLMRYLKKRKRVAVKERCENIHSKDEVLT